MKNKININDEHLNELEAEAIYVMREVAAQFENKVLLFSGGKDSIVLVHLARKAFWPARIPFSLMHIDTGHNFEETLKFRDDLAKEFGAEGIGLCRTEHMFFEGDRIKAMREMILAETLEARKKGKQ